MGELEGSTEDRLSVSSQELPKLQVASLVPPLAGVVGWEKSLWSTVRDIDNNTQPRSGDLKECETETRVDGGGCEQNPIRKNDPGGYRDQVTTRHGSKSSSTGKRKEYTNS